MSAINYCFVIPHYNHQQAFVDFFPRLQQLGIPAVVVDDGSDPQSVAAVQQMLAGFSEVYFLKHQLNRGKGTPLAIQSAANGYPRIFFDGARLRARE